MPPWWNGRHSGLKIRRLIRIVRVRIPPGAPYLLKGERKMSEFIEFRGTYIYRIIEGLRNNVNQTNSSEEQVIVSKDRITIITKYDKTESLYWSYLILVNYPSWTDAYKIDKEEYQRLLAGFHYKKDESSL